jgi:hypothetical protein
MEYKEILANHEDLSKEFEVANVNYIKAQDASEGVETPDLTMARGEHYRLREALDVAYQAHVDHLATLDPKEQLKLKG